MKSRGLPVWRLRQAALYATNRNMRKSLLQISIIAVASVLLVSCATTDPAEDKPDSKEAQSKGFLSQLTEETQGFSNPDGFMPPGLMSGGNRKQLKELETKSTQDLLTLKADEDIIFTDPDNPYADIKELDEAFSLQSERSKQWQQSYSKALRDARRSGKPILIWFHDSKYSPASQKISAELFKSDAFEDWAKDNLIRVCYDKSAEYDTTAPNKDQNVIIGNLATKKKEYVMRAFSHYGVKGTPNVIILTPDGRQVASWKGYSGGNSKNVMDRIRQDVETANKQFSDFKKHLSSAGYRDWTGKNGTKIFAKFVRYDPKKNMVWLKEFDGTQFSSSLNLLSDEDRAYVDKRQ